MTVNIESVFLQVRIPKQRRNCLSILWRPKINKLFQINENQRHVLAAKSSETCANYALNLAGLDNDEEYPIAANAMQNNTYLSEFPNLVKTSDEAIEVFYQLQYFPSQHANELKKWIKNNEAVTETISEHLQSISKTKELEVGLNTEGSTLIGLQ